MSRKLFSTVAMFCLCIFAGSIYAENLHEAYLLHAGDTVLISVWKEESLQKQVIVLPDGSVTIPLLGRVEVAGHSTPEVEQSLTLQLKKYFPEPIVSVVIIGIEGNRAYVTGKIVKAGSIVISGPTTVLQAISLAGGLDKFADESGIKIIRNSLGGQEILPVNYKEIISGKNISTNIQLKAGDTIVVP